MIFIKSLLEKMEEVLDPRCSRKKKHDCAEILTYVTMGYICGRTSLSRSLKWAEANINTLKKYMKLSSGIASLSTVSRLLSNIDEEIFVLTFTDWMNCMLRGKDLHIAIDGKALRAATKKIESAGVPYILNAIETASQMVITQMPIDLKTNEITAIPKIIETIEVEGNIVTIDAIGTQLAIMEKLDSLGAGFLLQVKKNQPQMYNDICKCFDCIANSKATGKEKDVFNTDVSEEKNRERYEYRKVSVTSNTEFLLNHEKMPYLKTIGEVHQVRILKVKDANGKDVTPNLKKFLSEGSVKQPKPKAGDDMHDTYQRVGIVSNKELTAREVAELKRNHWRIENGLHHVLDDAFREDRSPAKKSRNNLALIRKFAYNIIRYALLDLGKQGSVIEMMDYFADHITNLTKYIFEPMKPVNQLK